MSMQAIQSHHGVHLLTCEVPTSMEVISCFGLVHGQAIMGANFLKDFFAKVADVTGGRVAGYEKALNGATMACIEMMARRASDLGANTIVAVDVKTTAILGGRMLMATCTGTAFILREIRVTEEDTPLRREEVPVRATPGAFLHAKPLG